MSPFQMMLVAVVVFAAVFGGLILAQKALTRNGELALADGEPTAARPGRVVRGRGWKAWPDGGCRRTAADWSW